MEFKSPQSTWTVLLYAAGYNELEPEIFACFREIRDNLPRNVTLVSQMARAPIQLVAQMRPLKNHPNFDESWHGTRRMVYHQNVELFHEEISNISMADPESLRDFLFWGIKNYPSKYLMLILTGHGAGFMGAITDYQRNLRLIMSIKGLTKALEQAMINEGRHLDAVVLDACHMNMVEVWYEIANIRGFSIDFLFAPLGDLSLNGLPLASLVSKLGNTSSSQCLGDIFTRITKVINNESAQDSQLELINLNRKSLQILKEIISRWSRSMLITSLLEPGRSTLALTKIASLLPPNNSPSLRNVFRKTLRHLCLSPSLHELINMGNAGPSVYAPSNNNEYLFYKSQYDCLLFALNNHWTKLLEGNTLPIPTAIPISSIAASILEHTPGATYSQVLQTLKNIGWLEPMPISEKTMSILRGNIGAEVTRNKIPTRSVILR